MEWGEKLEKISTKFRHDMNGLYGWGWVGLG